MKDKIISIGDKIEMVELTKADLGMGEKRVYVSQVLEFDEEDDDIIRIAMPIYEGKLIPLQIGRRYSMSFYTHNGLYSADSVVENRYKADNVYMLDMRLSSELKKNQRRQYYRMDCNTAIRFKSLTDSEYEFLEVTGSLPDYIEMRDAVSGTALDISGGGMRFITSASVENGSVLLTELNIETDGEPHTIQVIGTVISVTATKYDSTVSEIRMNYIDITERDRELIIKYIFQEERRKRQRESGSW